MFLIAMVTAQTLLIVGTSAISLTTCWKSNEEGEEEEEVNQDVSKPQDPVESTSKPNEPEEKPLPPNIPEMAEDNANVRYVLQFNGDPTEEFVTNLNMTVLSANSWLWCAKKRGTASVAAWKDMAKRIHMLQTEGFDVLAGSDEAKQIRKQVLSQRRAKAALTEKAAPKKEKQKKKKKKEKAKTEGED